MLSSDKTEANICETIPINIVGIDEMATLILRLPGRAVSGYPMSGHSACLFLHALSNAEAIPLSMLATSL